MPVKIVRNDITKMECDAIVNAANTSLLGGGGVDGAIHRAAGRELLQECRALGGCRVGEAKVTKGYKLPARYVIHTVGPRWKDGRHGEQLLLESCYRESLKLAADLECESVAFPLISSGVYRYPKDQALKTAVDTITEFLKEHEMLVYIVIFDRPAFLISKELFSDISSYIDDNYVDTHLIQNRMRRQEMSERPMPCMPQSMMEGMSAGMPDAASSQSMPQSMMEGMSAGLPDTASSQSMPQSMMEDVPASMPDAADFQAMPQAKALSLEDMVNQVDESFSQMLLRMIDEKGMTDAQCYKKANVDRKLFSKIRSDIHYHPKKTTAIAFAIALELSMEETRDMLMKAGFALSHSSKFDIIIEYFILNNNYNIFEINEALFAFDQSLLG